MQALDLAVIAAYFALTLGVSAWASRGQGAGQDDYFLGARNLPAWGVMLSIVATETSALTVISVPGMGAAGNWSFVQLALGYCVGRIGVAIWLLPGYFSGQQQTAYERLGQRFGLPTRRLWAAIFLLTRLGADGVRIFAGAIPLALLTGWSLPWAIVGMGGVTLLYTLWGGLKAVVWADVLQLLVYLAGGMAALAVASHLAGGWDATWAKVHDAQRLNIWNWQWSLTAANSFWAALIGGALLSAASHGADHIIVQRLLATHSLRAARWALCVSGGVVLLQFVLFLAVGSAIWAADLANGVPSDQIFTRFVLQHLPAGLGGLVVAAVLAAAMSTISSSISALASSTTNDWYASWPAGVARSPEQIQRAGRWFSLAWGLALIAAALGFWLVSTQSASGQQTPVVVLALSIASVTYGALLGGLLLCASRGPDGRDLLAGAAACMLGMGVVVFAKLLGQWLPPLLPLAQLAWPWYVPLGLVLTVAFAWGSYALRRAR